MGEEQGLDDRVGLDWMCGERLFSSPTCASKLLVESPSFERI